MAQTNINITEKSEQDLVKINSQLIETVGKRIKNKADIINVCIGLAKESLNFLDAESISDVIEKSLNNK